MPAFSDCRSGESRQELKLGSQKQKVSESKKAKVSADHFPENFLYVCKSVRVIVTDWSLDSSSLW